MKKEKVPKIYYAIGYPINDNDLPGEILPERYETKAEAEKVISELEHSEKYHIVETR